MSKKIRVVVVDDSALVRSLLAEIINRQRDMECVGTANDPLVAREMIRELNPDVITLDVEMPRMDGIDFLGRLMRLRPMPVVMISTLTERGAEVTMKALETRSGWPRWPRCAVLRRVRWLRPLRPVGLLILHQQRRCWAGCRQKS